MGFEQLLFYIFASVLLFAALRVVTARNPVHAVLFLILGFFSSAALWLMLEAEFLAIVLVLVYVGAVMVLFLFVVMMLDINIAERGRQFAEYLPVGLVVAGLVLAEMVMMLHYRYGGEGQGGAAIRHDADYSNTRALGELLYTDYVYLFEIAAVVLLVAIVAAIALTMRRRPQTKYQNPTKQVRVKRDDRVRLVSMPAEKRQ